MTSTKQQTDVTSRSLLINRFMYGAFVLLGMYNLVFRRDPADAMSNFGIALIFDPFNQEIRWVSRPIYQRVWLVVHVALVFVLLGVTLLA
jgi:hypothetical protein